MKYTSMVNREQRVLTGYNEDELIEKYNVEENVKYEPEGVIDLDDESLFLGDELEFDEDLSDM